MRKVGLVIGVGILGAGLVAQQALPGVLKGHVQGLQDAQSLTAKVAITPAIGVSSEYTLTYSKPNLFKIERPDGFTVYDGKTLYEYTTSNNSYTESTVSPIEMLKKVGVDEIWVWTSFFDKTALQNVAGASNGKKRKLKGVDVSELVITMSGDRDKDKSITFFMDEKLGVARGINYQLGSKNFVAIATEFELGKAVLPATTFAFVAPDGAKKVEAPKPEDVKYAAVQAIFDKNCMPCHNSTGMDGGLDLSSYESVMASRGAVVKGEPDRSSIIRNIKGARPRMPKNRAPLSEAEVTTVSNWIKAGAKKD